MFDPNSRYARLPQAVYTQPDGRQVTYVTRRLLPQGEKMTVLQEVTVANGDRLDLLTNRTLGVPEAFWLVADANNAMNPATLLDEPGLRLRIPLPQV